jgi:DNA-binding response OmpR family regulator
MPGPRILLVDEEPFARSSLREALSRAGFEVLESGDGGEAVRLLECEAPDVVVVDVATVRQWGEETLARFRHGTTNAPARVLALTGRSEPADRELAVALGAADCMARPFSPSSLVRCARELVALDGRRAGTPRKP